MPDYPLNGGFIVHDRPDGEIPNYVMVSENFAFELISTRLIIPYNLSVISNHLFGLTFISLSGKPQNIFNSVYKLIEQ